MLSEPPAAGLNWLVYVVPPVAFCAGVFLLFLAFRTWRRTGATLASNPSTSETGPGSGNPSDSAGSSASQDEYAARLEEQLRKQR